MPFGLRPIELIIILVIILLLFGVGRISKIAGEMGSGIKEFRKNVRDEEKPADSNTPPAVTHPTETNDHRDTLT